MRNRRHGTRNKARAVHTLSAPIITASWFQ